jgi:hypothetical protein
LVYFSRFGSVVLRKIWQPWLSKFEKKNPSKKNMAAKNIFVQKGLGAQHSGRATRWASKKLA